MTFYRSHVMRFEVTPWNGEKEHAKYSLFHVGPEHSNYKLTVIFSESESSIFRNPFELSNGLEFTTRDRDNDLSKENCAFHRKYNTTGGWWLNKCGQFFPTRPIGKNSGCTGAGYRYMMIMWLYELRKDLKCTFLQNVAMMARPVINDEKYE